MGRDLQVPVFDADRPWGDYAPGAWNALLLRASHAMPAGLRRLVFVLRRVIRSTVDHPLDVIIWGYRLRLLPRGNMSETKLLFAPQLFDPSELALMARHLEAGGVFVDIGANAGAYSLWAHRAACGRVRVLAIEPDPEMRRRLQFNLATNGIAEVEVCPVALSDRDGVGALLVNPRQRGENTLVAEQARQAGGERVAQTVPLKTLLGLLQEHGVTSVDVLKIDIEGHELPVMRHFFSHAPPGLWPRLAITESRRETAAPIESLFAQRGYRQVLSTALNVAFEREAEAGK